MGFIVRSLISLRIRCVFIISLYNVAAIPGVLRDYCLVDDFIAKCPSGSIIKMEEARYGRMELGTCLTRDLGYMDCSSNVLLIMDQFCSGQQYCRVGVVKLEEFTSSCTDMVSYLRARYICLEVTTPSDDCCRNHMANTVKGTRAGYIGNSVSEATGCGYKDCPWIIQAAKGQQLNISIYDFGTYNYGLSKQDAWSSPGKCFTYAIITEKETSTTKTICSGASRSKYVYTTSSSTAEVQFFKTHHDNMATSYFLIGYEVVGCPDPGPLFKAKVERDGSHAIIKCFSNGVSWEIECKDRKWQGELANCFEDAIATDERSVPSLFTRDVYMVFVIAVAFVISLAIITAGGVCVQRLRSRNAAAPYIIKMNTMGLYPYPPDGAYAAREFEYNASYETPDFNKENYIYYLKHQSQNQSPDTPPGADRDNDNGYYSDHTYESPRCGHFHQDDSSEEQINQLDANKSTTMPHTPDGDHMKTCEVPLSQAHFTFPRSDKETYTELCHGINTV